MALPGRKPKTVAEKRVMGNPGGRPLTTVVPEPRPGDLLCPRAVAEDPRALTYWEMFLTNTAPGHLAPIDAPLLARLCIALSLADEATDKMKTTGMLVKAPNTGLPIQSPFLPVINKQTEIIRKLMAELALPPAQRNRLGGFEAREDDPAEVYFDA
jgi:P27 family predicted phage terminase small subunit